MKIAAVSDDGTTISQHFGRAQFYVVTTIENNQVISKETRAKPGHHSFASQPSAHASHEEKRGYGLGSEAKHQSMADVISDCQVILTGGMGWGAYQSMQNYNITPIVTDVENVDEAIQLYLSGKLTNLRERLH